jgi:hypothetical protein
VSGEKYVVKFVENTLPMEGVSHVGEDSLDTHRELFGGLVVRGMDAIGRSRLYRSKRRNIHEPGRTNQSGDKDGLR